MPTLHAKNPVAGYFIAGTNSPCILAFGRLSMNRYVPLYPRPFFQKLFGFLFLSKASRQTDGSILDINGNLVIKI
jgi:hypothetical protein